MGLILVGISSWAEPELVHSDFYPAEAKTPAARLMYYASRFTVAEIDSSYHFFPTQRNLAFWLENTPNTFKFDVNYKHADFPTKNAVQMKELLGLT